MNIERVKSEAPISIVTSSFQVYVEESLGADPGTFLLCTLRLRSDGAGFPNPLDSIKARIGSIPGELVWSDTLVLPGTVSAVVLVRPKRVSTTMKKTCLRAELKPGKAPLVEVPAGFTADWTASGAATPRSYPLNPAFVIDNCSEATFKVTAPGSAAHPTMEGMVAEFGDGANDAERFGIVVGVEPGIADGFAVRLSTLLTDPKVIQALGGV